MKHHVYRLVETLRDTAKDLEERSRKADSAVKKPAGTEAKVKRVEESSKEQPWNNDAPDYIPNSQAIVKFTDSKMPLSSLSKLLTPSGPIRYMRKGKRCKVHIGDFIQYAKKHYPADDIVAELASEYLANIEARKQATQALRKKKDDS
jgi:hypothetical protein